MLNDEGPRKFGATELGAQHVSMLDQRTPVARQIRGIFNASDAYEAQRMLNVAIKEWQAA